MSSQDANHSQIIGTQLHHGAERANQNNGALLGNDTIEQCAMRPYKWQYPATPEASVFTDYPTTLSYDMILTLQAVHKEWEAATRARRTCGKCIKAREASAMKHLRQVRYST